MKGGGALLVPVDTLERIPFGRFALMMSVNGTAIAAATIICIIRGLRAGGLALLALGRAPPPWPFAPDMLMMLLEGLQCANAKGGRGYLRELWSGGPIAEVSRLLHSVWAEMTSFSQRVAFFRLSFLNRGLLV